MGAYGATFTDRILDASGRLRRDNTDERRPGELARQFECGAAREVVEFGPAAVIRKRENGYRRRSRRTLPGIPPNYEAYSGNEDCEQSHDRSYE